jgi:ABC-type lipoprotein export system ATPase subunit
VLAIVATHDPLIMDLADHLVELRDGDVVSEEAATPVSAAPRAD